MILGEKIKLKRNELNFTQQELASQMHVSRQTISNWEVARSYPDIESLIRLSELFSISIDELLKEDLQVVESLKKRSYLEILYYIYLVSLSIGIIVCMGIDFIINHSLSWSLVVTSACMLAMGFLTTLKYSKSNKLIKSSVVASILLVVLFASVTFVADISFSEMCLIGSFWIAFYWIILLVTIKTNIRFWYLLAIATGLSIFIEWGMLTVQQQPLWEIGVIIGSIFDVILTIVFLFCGKLNVDKNWIDEKLQLFRNAIK